jgi:hypothetical protein
VVCIGWIGRPHWPKSRASFRPTASGFTGEMAGVPAFARWHTAHYLARHPAPPRDARPLQPADAAQFGLQLLRQTSFSHLWPLNCDELIAYLLTQSNLTARLKADILMEAEATIWLRQELSPFFMSINMPFKFAGSIGFWSRLAFPGPAPDRQLHEDQ